jgi:chaperonin cofactor prefoldin
MNTPDSQSETENEKIAPELTALITRLFKELNDIAVKILKNADKVDNNLLNLTLTFTGFDLLIKRLEAIDFPRTAISEIKKHVQELKEKINEIYAANHEQLQQLTAGDPCGTLLSTITASHIAICKDPLAQDWIKKINEGRNADVASEMQRLGKKINSITNPAAKACKDSGEEITTEEIMILSGLKEIERVFKNTIKEHYLNPDKKERVQSDINSIHRDLTKILEDLRKQLKTMPDDFTAISSKISAFRHAMLDLLNPPPPKIGNE